MNFFHGNLFHFPQLLTFVSLFTAKIDTKRRFYHSVGVISKLGKLSWFKTNRENCDRKRHAKWLLSFVNSINKSSVCVTPFSQEISFLQKKNFLKENVQKEETFSFPIAISFCPKGSLQFSMSFLLLICCFFVRRRWFVTKHVCFLISCETFRENKIKKN